LRFTAILNFAVLKFRDETEGGFWATETLPGYITLRRLTMATRQLLAHITT